MYDREAGGRVGGGRERERGGQFETEVAPRGFGHECALKDGPDTGTLLHDHDRNSRARKSHFGLRPPSDGGLKKTHGAAQSKIRETGKIEREAKIC